jgi:hypothetical protein
MSTDQKSIEKQVADIVKRVGTWLARFTILFILLIVCSTLGREVTGEDPLKLAIAMSQQNGVFLAAVAYVVSKAGV